MDLQANSQITQYIYECSVASGYAAFNWFGSETIEQHIYDVAFGVGHNYSISFYIGHGDSGHVFNRPYWEWQYWIRDDSGGDVFDKDIYPYSKCQNVRFVFLWSCHQGDDVGGWHWPVPFGSGGAYGMPHAWLHTTDLPEDGYADPDDSGYCFIGFQGDAPGLLKEFDGEHWAAGYYFLGYFYEAALCTDKTINQALDYASQKLWQVNFGESTIHTGIPELGQMVVYGDGNLKIGSWVLPPSLPLPPAKPGTAYLTISTTYGGDTNPAPGTYTYGIGEIVTITASPYEYYRFYHRILDGTTTRYENPINVTMNSDHTLKAYFSSDTGGDGGGGCPTLFVWNGSDYLA